MQTQLKESFRNTPEGKRADAILRNCVHCGFCNATCPTYQLTGDELDGPRGRIYLIKEMLETGRAGISTRLHLDRCLTCLNCQTTCPSGVAYGQLLEIGRARAEAEMPRGLRERLLRKVLRLVLPHTRRFRFFLRLGQAFRPFLPTPLKRKIPQKKKTLAPARSAPAARRKMLLLEGCVQPALSPETNQAAMTIFGELGIHLFPVREAGCCGAVSHHLNATEEARRHIRRNIDAWWPHVEAGIEAIVVTASGCGLMVKEYAELMRDDPEYAEKAEKISALTRDPVEILENENLSGFRLARPEEIVFHPPCTLQHGQKLAGRTESLLTSLGYRLQPVQDSHLCCGSAGTYSILQPEFSARLLHNKLENLQRHRPPRIVTANIGCQQHLQTGTELPVVHWLELLKKIP